jgi:hypothetical protein
MDMPSLCIVIDHLEGDCDSILVQQCSTCVLQHVQSRWGMQNLLKENIAVTCLKKKTSMQCKQ